MENPNGEEWQSKYAIVFLSKKFKFPFWPENFVFVFYKMVVIFSIAIEPRLTPLNPFKSSLKTCSKLIQDCISRLIQDCLTGSFLLLFILLCLQPSAPIALLAGLFLGILIFHFHKWKVKVSSSK